MNLTQSGVEGIIFIGDDERSRGKSQLNSQNFETPMTKITTWYFRSINSHKA